MKFKNKILKGIVAFTVITSQFVSCLGTKCAEAPMDGLYSIAFEVLDNTGASIMTVQENRESLKITNLDTGLPVTPGFSQTPVDATFIGDFWLADNGYDARARDAVTCGNYKLTLRTNDVDTLKLCYHVKYDSKCSSSKFDSIAVYWNGKPAYPGKVGYTLQLPD
jgi:hypothetical protein